MHYKIAIVEDDQRYVEIVKVFLERFSNEFDVVFDIDEYSDGEDFTLDYQLNYQIVFLDIEMERLDGLSTAKEIRLVDEDIIIIFISNKTQYAVSGYAVEAQAYLLKPINYFMFQEELKKAIDRIKNKTTANILVKHDESVIKVNTDNIIYVESIKHKLLVVTKDKSYEINGPLKNLEKSLEKHHFYRSNNCYLINLKYVKKVENEFVTVGGYELKVSRSRKKGLMEALITYFGDTF